MSVCSKYVSYYILIVYLQYIVVLSLLSCLHEENEPEMEKWVNKCITSKENEANIVNNRIL